MAQAGRMALLVDGDEYFRVFAHAAQRATRSICIVGWDFHSQMRLIPAGDSSEVGLLGDFLNSLARRRRDLHIYVLVWDYPMLFAKGRELPPIYGFGWRPHRHVHVRYDASFPAGASHHQKLVVIDDALAFCGGLDLTRSRWDTSEHRPKDPRRINPGEEEPYPPFHDVTMAVDGDAARALGEVVRERWKGGAREVLPDTSSSHDPWPPELAPTLTDVDVAIARTMGEMDQQPAVREVLALYLDMIAAANRCIYIENQYFTSNALSDALAARLAQPEGPEVIVVLRLSTEGWLEAPTMGALRTELLKKLRSADRYGRFHPYYPHIPDLPGEQCCDLHSKLIIVDDESLQLGSANFCNRSMGLDTECDVAIEARNEPRVTGVIRDFRNRLLAEHLDVPVETVTAAHAQRGSLSAAIASLRSDGRTLRRYERLDEPSELMISIASVADLEQPVSLDRLIDEFVPETTIISRRPAWMTLLIGALVVVALWVAWRYTPLERWTDAEQVLAWAEAFSRWPWAPFLLLAAYTPAAIVMFPRPLITLLAVAAFGPWLGFTYALAGILLAAAATYAVGRRLDRSFVRRLAGTRINRLSQLMKRRGLFAVIAVRLLPIAPFVVVNLVAGALRIRLRHFVIGSAIGILPGTLLATIFGDQLVVGLRDPGAVNFGLIAGAVLVAFVAIWAVRRWMLRSQLGTRGAGHVRDG